MPRPPRYLFSGGIYHVIARGNNRMKLFHDKQDYRFYRKLWIQAKKKFSLNVYRWCFMPNHIHLIVTPKTDDGLSLAMHYIQHRYAKYYGRRYKWVGHVWQGRYTSRLIADDRYLYQCGNYVENNPVRAGLIDRAEDYVWSSAYGRSRGFMDGLTDDIHPSEIPDPIEPLSIESIPEEAERPLEKGRRVLGSEDQIKKLTCLFGDEITQKRGRPHVRTNK